MSGFLVDTCAVSEFTRSAPDLGVIEWFSRVDPGTLFLSAATIGELRYGIALVIDRKKRQRLEQWLVSDLLVDFASRLLPFDADVAQRWGSVRAKLRAAGKPMPVIDAMIAATALHYNLSVVTRNESDFRQIDVEVVNPWRT